VAAQTWTFGKKIGFGFGLAVALLLIVGVVAYRSNDALVENNHRVTHSHQVLEDVAGTLSDMKDAETGQRGFLLTGNETYLEPYNHALASIDRALTDLRELTADNPHHQARLVEAQPLIDAKLAELNAPSSSVARRDWTRR
jgi:CHASE3 domain sensor protein